MRERRDVYGDKVAVGDELVGVNERERGRRGESGEFEVVRRASGTSEVESLGRWHCRIHLNEGSFIKRGSEGIATANFKGWSHVHQPTV